MEETALLNDSSRPLEEIIAKLYNMLKEKNQQIETSTLVSESYERQIQQNKLIIKDQATKIIRQESELAVLKAENNQIRLELESLKSYLNFCKLRYESLAHQVIPPYDKSKADNRIKGFFKENRQINHSRKTFQSTTEKDQGQYIIQKIKLKKQPFQSKEILSRFREDSFSELPSKICPGETLGEDFFVIGPDTNDISIAKIKNKSIQELALQPTFLYKYNKEVKAQSCSKRKDILLRSFPNKIKASRLAHSQYSLTLRQILQYFPSPNLNSDYFIFTLRGEDDLRLNPPSLPHLQLLEQCNVNRSIFILCLKLKDIVTVRSKTSPPEYWLTEKTYVLMSFYPFFDCHIKMMVELERQNVINRLRAVDLNSRTGFGAIQIRDFTRIEGGNQILRSYLAQKVVNTDWVKVGGDNVATIPLLKEIKYVMGGFASGYVFGNICYDEFLVILTAVLCEKTVVFVSSSPSLASFTALTFISLISPFRYPHPQILNADQQKVSNIIFQSPVPLIVSISIDPANNKFNLNAILDHFLDASFENQHTQTQFILVDLDSSSILLDRGVRNELEKIVPMPNDELRIKYQRHNTCRPKSVPLMKPMEKVASGVLATGRRCMNRMGERDQKKKQIERDYKEQLELNQSAKLLQTKPDYEVVKMIRSFVQMFAVKDIKRKLQRREDSKDQVLKIKRKLYEELSQYKPFLGVFMQTQIFSSYLDSQLQFS